MFTINQILFIMWMRLLSLCGLAILLPACGGTGTSGTASDSIFPKEGDVKMLTTTTTKSFDLAASSLSFGERGEASPQTIRINTALTYQPIDGFGAAITGSTAYNLLKMDAADRDAFLRKTFSPTEGYGFSYVRVCIGCSDFSLSEYTCCDTEGIEHFALTAEETDYVIPVLKEILAINPELKIMGSPWTAPRWMKVADLEKKTPTDSWTSGYLNPDHYQDYATYFVKWIKAFAENGINIYAVTLQNEPLNHGNSASMFMGWEQQRDFIKTAVGPTFEREGIRVKIYAFDHNYNYDGLEDQQDYPLKIYADPEASKYIAGAAYHNYGGDKDELYQIHDAYPGKELVFTESTQGDWNDGSNFPKLFMGDMEEIALGTVNRWCRGAIVWNLMLDADRGPNRPGGCINGFGAVDIGRDYKEIRYNSFYYIMAHMASVVAPGAVRVGSEGFTAEGLTYAAFLNPDATIACVVCNNHPEARELTIDDGTHAFKVEIPAEGVVSLKWQAG